ncbi:hypothetical protein I3842_14G125100 [Carya illinoinensis]|uniref:Uncharacterized protein n=1 Tax=Carya illinoinensis TaxID=32201 RepID=A0A922ADI7_CARIL|nr:hypothetical protein I3842_14G125100 [Carya illinoinensis]
MNRHYIDCLNFDFTMIAPAIVLDVPRDSQVMQEKIFGHLMPILAVSAIVTIKKCIFL